MKDGRFVFIITQVESTGIFSYDNDMRIPTRRGEKLKQQRDDQTAGLLYLTQAGVKKMQEQLKRLESEDLPQAIRDVRTTAEFGDFSENAEYQEAKARMRRLHSQIFGLKEKLKLVSIISRDRATDRVQLGSTVVLESGGAAGNESGARTHLSCFSARRRTHWTDDRRSSSRASRSDRDIFYYP